MARKKYTATVLVTVTIEAEKEKSADELARRAAKELSGSLYVSGAGVEIGGYHYATSSAALQSVETMRK